MFHAACAASHRPALRPTRGSGVGAAADTMGATGEGMTAGAGGGGGGGLPRPPRPPADAISPPAGAADASPGGVAAAGGSAATGAGAFAGGGGVAAGGGLGCGAAAGDALGVTAGGAVFDEAAHAATPNTLVASTDATHKATIHFMGDLP